MSLPVYVVLLHHPIVNRQGTVVTTAVTNLDIHDIARTARTYGAKGYFLVTPIRDQHELVGRILSHWREDTSRQYHPDRFEALSQVRLMATFEEVIEQIESECGEKPEVVLTDAQRKSGSLAGKQVSYRAYRAELEQSSRTRPVLVVFGTGWGVAEGFYPKVDRLLDPVFGREGEGGYNHLSVRAAAAAVLDRLFGQ